MVQRSAGMAAWRASTNAQSTDLITDRFNEISVWVAKRVFLYEKEVVDFDVIYSRVDNETSPWQEMIPIKVVKLCLETYHAIIANDDLQRLQAFWARVSRCKEIEKLGLRGEG